MNDPTVAVIVPTIPERLSHLSACLSSIAWQTRRPDSIIVETDHAWAGPAHTRNRACSRASDHTFYAFLDDDDTMERDHLEVLLDTIGSADVAFSRPLFGGPLVWNPTPPSPEHLPALRANNWVPVTTLVRATTFWQVGGFDPTARFEDWDLWIRLVEHGATFRSTERTTWTYTQHGEARRSGLGATS